MTQDTYGQWMGTPMDRRDIDALLRSEGWGVLSLASGDEPYSLPISFGWDGERVYFAFLVDSPTSRKTEFVADDRTGRLLVTDVDGRFDWESVAVTGPLRSLERDTDGWTAMMDALEDNAWFSPEFERSSTVGEIHGWRLRPEELRGLAVRADED